jgi:hypothetical protein
MVLVGGCQGSKERSIAVYNDGNGALPKPQAES